MVLGCPPNYDSLFDAIKGSRRGNKLYWGETKSSNPNYSVAANKIIIKPLFLSFPSQYDQIKTKKLLVKKGLKSLHIRIHFYVNDVLYNDRKKGNSYGAVIMENEKR